jgi:hypothetical protein
MRNDEKMSGIGRCLEIVIKIIYLNEDIAEEIIKKGFVELLSNIILETKVSNKEINRTKMIRKAS